MPSIIVFLLGIITSATTSLGDKTQAALRMVGLGHAKDIPEQYRYLADGTKVAVTPAAPVDHGIVGNWLHAMASDHPMISLAMVVLIVLYVVYKVRVVSAAFAGRGRGVRS